MKNLCLVFILNCLLQTSFSQTVTLENISKYEGETVTICEKVQSAFLSNKESKTAFLNFGYPFPNETFRVVIFESTFKNFNYAPSEFLKNKRVCITGKVVIYKGRPQMVISKESQIKIE